MAPDSVFFSDELIVEVQEATPDAVIEVLSLVTLLGNVEFFIVLLTVYYWWAGREKGLPILAVGLTAAVVSGGLKEVFGLPRPPTELHVIEASHYGLPSGHALSPLLIYGALLYSVGSLTRIQKVVVGFVLIFTISISRIFLGVHYPADTLTGWAVGGALLALFVAYAELGTDKTVVASVVVSAPFFVVYPGVENVVLGFGGLAAVVVGWRLKAGGQPLEVRTLAGAVALVAGLVVVGVGWIFMSEVSGIYVFFVTFLVALFVVFYTDLVARAEDAVG